MNKQYEYQQNLRGSPDNFFEKWLFWHGMTLLLYAKYLFNTSSVWMSVSCLLNKEEEKHVGFLTVLCYGNVLFIPVYLSQESYFGDFVAILSCKIWHLWISGYMLFTQDLLIHSLMAHTSNIEVREYDSTWYSALSCC